MRRLWDFFVVTARRFDADHCFTRASALAYVSLLSVVPLLAVMFSALKGLGVERRLEPLLLSRLSLDTATTETIMGYIDRTNFGTLGLFGGVTLMLTIYSLMGSIEASFNQIWRVRRGRTRWQEVTHYFGVVLLTPFLLVTGVALTSSLQIESWVAEARDFRLLGDAVGGLLAAVPIFMNIGALVVLYAVMPNRRPWWPSVMLGAIAAGVGWHLVQVGYLQLQFGVARYNAIYGALSQLPVTLVWQYVSWVVVLAGAEMAAVFEFGVAAADAGEAPANELAVCLEILERAARAFACGSGPTDIGIVARQLRVPIESATRVARWMETKGWLVATQGDGEPYVLAVDVDAIRLGALDELAADGPVPPGCSPGVARMVQALARARQDAWERWTLADALAESLDTATPKIA